MIPLKADMVGFSPAVRDSVVGLWILEVNQPIAAFLLYELLLNIVYHFCHVFLSSERCAQTLFDEFLEFFREIYYFEIRKIRGF